MIGDTIKVYLPGESPWAEVMEEANGTVKARIINKLFNEYSEHEQAQFMKREMGDVKPLEQLHVFRKGDEIWFRKGDYDEWVPVQPGHELEWFYHAIVAPRDSDTGGDGKVGSA